jgi:hypothetical protein
MLVSLAVTALAACGDDDGQTCGTDAPAPAEAVLVAVGDLDFSYGGFHAALAGDCPLEPGSRGSVTIAGQQTGTSFALTLCIRREDDVVSGQAISLADATFVQVVDASALDADGCTYGKDISAEPTGTVTFDGFCTTSGTQLNMTLAGAIGGVKTCTGGSDPVTLTLSGSVLVTMEDSTQ